MNTTTKNTIKQIAMAMGTALIAFPFVFIGAMALTIGISSLIAMTIIAFQHYPIFMGILTGVLLCKAFIAVMFLIEAERSDRK